MRVCRIILLLCSTLLYAQMDITQEEQDFLFAGQLAFKGMYDLAGLQYLKYADTYASSPRAPEALYRAAEAYEKLPAIDKATDIYLQLLLKYPQSAFIDKALFNRAKLLAAAGRLQDAALSFERLRLFTPNSEWAPLALLLAGRSSLQAHDDKRALEAAYTFLDQYPTDPLRFEARYLIAQIRFRQQQYQQTMLELDRLFTDRLQDTLAVKANLLRGQTLYAMGRYRLADSLFAKLIASPVSSDSIGAAGWYFCRVLHHRGDYELSNQHIKILLEKHRQIAERPQLLLLQGDNDYALGDYAAALDRYHALEAVLPDSVKRTSFWLRQALALRKANRPQEALAKMQGYLALPEKEQVPSLSFQVAMENSRLLCEMNRATDAILLLRQSLSKNPLRKDQILFALADIQITHLQDPVAAAGALTTLRELYPDSPLQDDALWVLAQAWESQGRYESALREYERYVALYPAGDQLAAVRDRIHYLRNYLPLDAHALQAHLLGFVASQWSGMDRIQLAYSWAEKLAYVFHDHQQALTVLRMISEEALPADRQVQMLTLQAECHLALAEKARYNDQLDQQQAQIDSAQQIVATLQERNLAGTLPDRLFLSQLAAEPSVERRFNFLNSASSRQVIPQMADSTKAIINYRLAEICYQVAQDTSRILLSAGLNACRSVLGSVQASPIQADVLLLQAKIYRSLLNPDSAKTTLQKYFQQYPNHPGSIQAWWQLAEIETEQNRWEEALRLYQDIQQQYPYSDFSAKAATKSCHMLYRLGKFDQAQKCIEQVLALHIPPEWALFFFKPVDDELLWFYAASREAAGPAMAAVQAYQDYLLKSPTGRYRALALFHLAELCGRLGYDDASAGHYQELLDQFPQDSLASVACLRLADAYFQSGKYEEAKKKYQALKAVAEGDKQRYGAGREILCEFNLNNFSRAKSLIEGFKKQYSDRSFEAQFILAQADIYLAGKEFKPAEELFKEVSSKYKETPEGSRGDLGLARLYILLNRNEEALKLLTAIPDKYSDPKVLGAAYVTLGEFYYANQQFENCIAAGRKAYELTGAPRERAQAIQLLIRVYDDVHLWDRAIGLLREYLQTYPEAEDKQARQVQLGIFLINMKEYERAIAHLQDLRRSVDAETEAEVQYWIAKAYNDRGLAQEAIIEYLKVKYLCKPTKLPWGTTALYEAGQAYYKLGELEKARSLFISIVRELGAADQFGRVAGERVQEIDAELARMGKKS